MLRPRLFLFLSIFLSLSIICLSPIARFFKPYLPFTNYLLGVEKPTSYLILLGNDAEVRANGGFTGSYAKIVIARESTFGGKNEVLKQSPSPASSPARSLLAGTFSVPNLDLSFQDIYVPDGQLKGYVTPPAPIQEAFHHGTWQLSNGDWEPDFPTSATSLRWFFEKGNEINPDNLAIINLTTIKKILDVVGSFTVPEFEAKITPDNLYLFLQGKTEVNFFPGSTQKKDTLTAVGHAFKQALFDLPLNKKIKVAQILYQDLVNQNIVINSQNPEFQAFLEKKNFAGVISSNTPDTYLLIETNLGANKANAYVKRETTHHISFQNGQTIHAVSVKFTNSSAEANPNPPFHYGGDYITYLRFYLPSNAQNIQVASSSGTVIARESAFGGKNEATKQSPTSDTVIARNIETKQSPTKEIKTDISVKYNLTELGFWQTTPAQNQTIVNLSYTLPVSQENYSLTILKQHGFATSPQTINLNGKSYSTPLTADFFLP